jgi:4-amino-4-deoxy-L-arabinose transferase-like glycosyltransferase
VDLKSDRLLANDSDDLVFRTRCAMSAFGIALGALVWFCSRRIFGPSGAIISLVVYVFSPTILAHSALVTTDLPASFFFLAASASAWTVMHVINFRTFLAITTSVAGLFLTKMSAPIIVLIVLAMLVVRFTVGGKQPLRVGRRWTFHSRRMQLAIFGLVACSVVCTTALAIWTTYGFRYSALRTDASEDRLPVSEVIPPNATPWDVVLSASGPQFRAIEFANHHKLLPESYLYGLAYMFRNARHRYTFLNGEISPKGSRLFFPYAFFVKTPIAVLLLATMSFAGAVFWRRFQGKPCRSRRTKNTDEQGRLYQSVAFFALIVVYGGIAITSNLNIGHRHILPIYPPMFVLLGGSVVFIGRAARPFAVAMLATIFGLIVTTAMQWPHYLSFFNTFADGSDNGYQHLVDSSLDWGQDLPALRDWLRRHAGTTGSPLEDDRVYLSYFGTADPRHFSINANYLPSVPGWANPRITGLGAGFYCISATMLQQVGLLSTTRWDAKLEQEFQSLHRRANHVNPRASRNLRTFERERYWDLAFGRLCMFLRQREPDARAGHSILIYKLDQAFVQRALTESVPRR